MNDWDELRMKRIAGEEVGSFAAFLLFVYLAVATGVAVVFRQGCHAQGLNPSFGDAAAFGLNWMPRAIFHDSDQWPGEYRAVLEKRLK